MLSSDLKYSVVIPCYNEEKNLKFLVERLEPLTKEYANIEILLVNNGSTDNSETVALDLLKNRNLDIFRYVKVEKNQGYGFGILSGLKAATGDILSWTHADLQTPPSDLIRGLKILLDQRNKGSVVVKGKRYGRPLFDQFFTKMMEVYANFTLRTSINDINAQPKIFTREFYEKYILASAPWDFSLDLYLLWMAQRNKISILDFPVTFENRLYGEAKGGGNFKLKWKLTKRTYHFIKELKDTRS